MKQLKHKKNLPGPVVKKGLLLLACVLIASPWPLLQRSSTPLLAGLGNQLLALSLFAFICLVVGTIVDCILPAKKNNLKQDRPAGKTIDFFESSTLQSIKQVLLENYNEPANEDPEYMNRVNEEGWKQVLEEINVLKGVLARELNVHRKSGLAIVKKIGEEINGEQLPSASTIRQLYAQLRQTIQQEKFSYDTWEEIHGPLWYLDEFFHGARKLGG